MKKSRINHMICRFVCSRFHLLMVVLFALLFVSLYKSQTTFASDHVSVAILPYTKDISDSDRAITLTAVTLISYALDSFPEVSVVRESVVRMAAGENDVEKLWNKTHDDVSKMMSFRKVDILVLCRFTRINGKVKSEYVLWNKSEDKISVELVNKLDRATGVYDIRNAALKEISIYAHVEKSDTILKNLWIENNEKNIQAFSDGLVNIYDERTAQGLSALENLSKKSPGFRDLHYFLGIYYAEYQFDYMASINSFRNVLKISPTDACAYFQLGFVYRLKSEYRKAIEEFENAVSLKPGYYEAHIHLAMIYSDSGEYAHSEQQYRNALSIRSDSGSVWYSLAGVLVVTGKLDEALTAVKKAIELEPETFKKIARRDMDLAPLRVLPEFNKIIMEY